ncbi:putative methyltransferase-domain-containing protein [Schizophyllum commune]
MKPNFPDGLRITPSCKPSLPGHSREDDAFGWSAQAEAIERYGIAGRVWEASYIMEEYLDPKAILDPPGIFAAENSTQTAENGMHGDAAEDGSGSGAPKVILELGSGTGLLSARMAELASLKNLIIATDLPEVCPLIEKNIGATIKRSACSVAVRPLAWGDAAHVEALRTEYFSSPNHKALTHIVCSDLVYFPELLAPLLRALLSVSAAPFIDRASPPTIAISYKVRSLVKESPFWSAFGLWFNFAPVLAKDSRGRWRRVGAIEGAGDDAMFLFVAQRKAESLDWPIPDSDEELLGGVGAEGTMSRKGDSTFESLLLMDISD